MQQKNSERIKVAIRLRPFVTREKEKGCQKCVFIDIDRGEIVVKKLSDSKEGPRNFTFDKVYDDSFTQERIFNETSLPIIESVVQGYNGTIFAYGQTGTGKTFTMEGDIKSDIEKGIIPRSFEMIFNLIKTTFNTNYLIRVSFLEIYNEEINDLLSKTNDQQKLEIKENPDKGFYVKDLSTWVVKSPKDMVELLEKGKDLRHTAETKMNGRSSRSHSIFSIIVENSNTEESIRSGKLNLVDLAGSERQSKTETTGKNFHEGVMINLSLTALGKVINALVSDKKQHIPYRDSKLTKLLADSLGGNSKTVMIANIGPADYNYDETLTTLRYANRAKDIKNQPKINEDPKDAMIRQYQDELGKLKKMLTEAGGLSMGEGGMIVTDKIISLDSKKKIEEMEAKIQAEKEQILKEVESEKKKIEESKNTAEDEKLKLLDKLKQKQEKQNKQNTYKESLLNKLKVLEEKFVAGEENEKKAKENEEIINMTKKDIEDAEEKRNILRHEFEMAEEEKMIMQNKFQDQKSEVKKKIETFEKLKDKLKELEMEQEDLNKEFERSNNEIFEYKSQIDKEISYKDVLINHILPQKYVRQIERLLKFDEDANEWFIEGLGEYMHHLQLKNQTEDADDKHSLAMGFNDDEGVFSQDFMSEDMQLSMILDINNPPQSVYSSYGDVIKPKVKKLKIKK